jgi:hypothetical protein
MALAISFASNRNRRQWLEALQKEIAACRDVDIPTDILKNMELSGRPLLEIAQNPLFSAAILIQAHGKKLHQLAESQAAGLQKQFDAFKSEKRETLKELGLV